MNMNAASKVGELAAAFPGSTRIFEKIGIDYCCGGTRSLQEACLSAGVKVDEVLAFLSHAAESKATEQGAIDWRVEPLARLIAYILEKHHVFTRQELIRLDALMEKVCGKHAQNHPELIQIQALFGGLQQELFPHMLKEEQMLFPYIVRMEEALNLQKSIPIAVFGTVQNPVRMMMLEHDNAGNILRAIRSVSINFALPPDACADYRTLYQGIEEFERDLHHHIQLENNVLFPRAVRMEGEK